MAKEITIYRRDMNTLAWKELLKELGYTDNPRDYNELNITVLETNVS